MLTRGENSDFQTLELQPLAQPLRVVGVRHHPSLVFPSARRIPSARKSCVFTVPSFLFAPSSSLVAHREMLSYVSHMR